MLAAIPSELLRSLRLTLVVAAITGLVYPLAITGVAQVLFHDQANGSLVTRNGQVVGSRLIGQQFASPRYFHGRPSATVDPSTGKPRPYAAENSTGSNYGPSNQALVDRVTAGVRTVRDENGLGSNVPVPVDLVTTDFTGFDSDITEAAALVQVDRVAGARQLSADRVRAVVERHAQGRVLWIFGEPHVNVLDVNMALDSGEAG